MTKVNPYISFTDTCEEAFSFYKSVFGGEYLNIERFEKMPSDTPIPEEDRKKILHVSLPISKETVLMGSDTPSFMGKVNFGNHMAISIHPDSESETKRIFNELSAGGKIVMPLEKQFWNALFGMFIDKFGISWMVNYECK